MNEKTREWIEDFKTAGRITLTSIAGFALPLAIAPIVKDFVVEDRDNSQDYPYRDVMKMDGSDNSRKNQQQKQKEQPKKEKTPSPEPHPEMLPKRRSYCTRMYAQSNQKMRISERGKGLIKLLEGFRHFVYKDSAGKETIAYGHLIKEGENYYWVSHAQGERILLNDIMRPEKCIDKYVKVKLTQNMYDALVSLTYNIGTGAFKESTLLKELNRGRYKSAANKMMDWVYAGGKVVKGLKNRRKAEREHFLGKPQLSYPVPQTRRFK